MLALDKCRLDEARRLFTESLEIAREIGNVYCIAGDLHYLAYAFMWQGDYHEAQLLYEEALELNRFIGNRTYEKRNLGMLGRAAFEQGRFAEAQQLYSSAQSINAEIGDELGYAYYEYSLGLVAASMENHADARRHFETGIQLTRTLGHKAWLALCLAHLGALHCDLGEYNAAEPLLSEALAIGMGIGSSLYALPASASLALLSLETGKLPEAIDYLTQTFRLAAEANRPRGTSKALQICVLVLAKADRASHAALLAYGVIHHVKRVGLGFSRKWHSDLDESIARCGAMLTPEQLRQLEREAASMSLDQLTEFALTALAELQAELGKPQAADSPAPMAAGN